MLGNQYSFVIFTTNGEFVSKCSICNNYIFKIVGMITLICRLVRLNYNTMDDETLKYTLSIYLQKVLVGNY